jgi:hypothetical protein
MITNNQNVKNVHRANMDLLMDISNVLGVTVVNIKTKRVQIHAKTVQRADTALILAPY